jgi:hypothetical protein
MIGSNLAVKEKLASDSIDFQVDIGNSGPGLDKRSWQD